MGSRHTRSTSSWPGSPRGSPSAGTGSSSRPRRAHGPRCASRAGSIRAAARATRRRSSTDPGRGRGRRAMAGRRCSRSAASLPMPRGPGPAGRSGSARPQPPARGAARRGRVRHRPRPRPVRAERGLRRAAPLPLAERRELPRAERADPLHPGSAAAGRDLLRPARRADGEPRATSGADGAVLPRPLRARRRREPPPTRPSMALVAEEAGSAEADAPAPGQDRVLPRGGARRAAALPARAPPPAARPRLGGGGLAPGAGTRSGSRGGCATGSHRWSRATRRPRS